MRRSRQLVGIVSRSFLAVLALLLTASVGHLWLQWRRVAHGDPARDAARAISSGDRRLLALEGVALYIPGTDSTLYDAATAGRCSFRIIYAGDRFLWAWEHRLHDATMEYARAYNESLVARVGRNGLCRSTG